MGASESAGGYLLQHFNHESGRKQAGQAFSVGTLAKAFGAVPRQALGLEPVETAAFD